VDRDLAADLLVTGNGFLEQGGASGCGYYGGFGAVGCEHSGCIYLVASAHEGEEEHFDYSRSFFRVHDAETERETEATGTEVRLQFDRTGIYNSIILEHFNVTSDVVNLAFYGLKKKLNERRSFVQEITVFFWLIQNKNEEYTAYTKKEAKKMLP
jgi:hypothetical protein